MKKILISVVIALCGISAAAQKMQTASFDYFLPDTCDYNPAIPRPADILGFEIGEMQALHENAVAYFNTVAAISDRVMIVNYGRTNERKPLCFAVISSPENLANLDQIKKQHDMLQDPKAKVTIDENTPVFTWLGHSVHGNETSGFNASFLLLYHLAASNHPETLEWLKHSIIIVDPANNPDGIDRFAEWANQHRSELENNDTQEREHIEQWPGGRFNHYWFDLNRDWLNQQQPESRARAQMILEWHPNVYTCSHEQNTENNFHFSPGAPSRVHPLIFDECIDLIGKIAKNYYAPAFDKQKMMYFSGEVYDDYYIGRGREYFDFHGGLAFLWEQGSPRGFLQHTDNGDLSFKLGIHNQLTLELATIRGCTQMRKELNEYQREFFTRSYKEGVADKTGSWVFGSTKDFGATVRLAEVIKRNGVNVYKLGKDVSAAGVKFVADSAFVVPLDQNRYRLIQGIFEIRKEYADSIAYDITGWTMPMSFNLDYAQVKGASLGDEYQISDTFKSSIIGEQDPQKVYAYAFEWTGFFAPRALYRLLSAGVYAKVTKSEIVSPEKTFGYGSIFVPLGEVYQTLKPEQIKAIIDTITEEDMIDVYALSSGYTSAHNVGSPELKHVELPRVAILGGSGANATAVGGLWFLLDKQYKIKSSIVPVEELMNLDLSRYNTIFVCGAFPKLSEQELKKLKDWTAAGNTLVATEAGLSVIAKAGIADFKAKPVEYNHNVPYANYATSVRSQGIQGVIFGTKIDPTHPLCWGYTKDTLPVFKNNTILLENVGNALRTPVVHTDPVLLSGNVTASVLEKAASTPVEVITKVGKGRCVYLAVDATFRGIWYGSSKLIANTMFFADKVSPAAL